MKLFKEEELVELTGWIEDQTYDLCPHEDDCSQCLRTERMANLVLKLIKYYKEKETNHAN
jgi:hypothetical protein